MQFVTREQMELLERLAAECGFTMPMMTEHAGMQLARFAQKYAPSPSVLILCGNGQKGAAGLAAARHLANWGYRVRVLFPEEPTRFCEAGRSSLEILKHLPSVVVEPCGRLGTFRRRHALVIDALIGYQTTGDPRTAYARVIQAANDSGKPIVSCDIPSGLDATSGLPGIPTVRAKATLALGAVKNGLMAKQAKQFVGKLYLGDVSIPSSVYTSLDLRYDTDIFAKKSIIFIK